MTKIHVVPHQHFDIIWRRPVEWYEKRRKDLYKQALDLLEKNPTFTFTFCQALTFRTFLETNRKRKASVINLLKEKRLEFIGGPETICDLNMSSGISILKNIESGKNWFKEELGYEIRAGAFEDAFGVSAQLPQILKISGYDFYKAGRMPQSGQNDLCGDFLWEGTDGSQIKCISPLRDNTLWGWGYSENPDKSVKLDQNARHEKIYNHLKKTASLEKDRENMLFVAMGEEHDILESIVEILPRLNEETGAEFIFSTFTKYYDSLPDDYWQTRPVASHKTDLSRIFTGCYASRYLSKKHPRNLEHKLIGAQFENAEKKKKIDYSPAWKNLFIMQFHDAICGCHVSENAKFLKRLYKQSLDSLNAPQKILIPWEPYLPNMKEKFTSSVKATSNQSWGKFKITTENDALRNITYKNASLGKLCEISLREDSGTLWTEEYSDKSYLFSGKEKIERMRKSKNFLEATTSGENSGFRKMWPGFSQLVWKKTLLMHKSGYIFVNIELDWLGNSTEIALRWNSSFVNNCNIEIPFGSRNLNAYQKTEDTIWGESFPVLNWAKTDDFILFNNGTPAHVIRNGKLETILLRSPVKRWSPWFPVTPDKTSWDNGKSQFSFLWAPNESRLKNSDLHRIGMEFNLKTECEQGCFPWAKRIPENLVIAEAEFDGEKTNLLLFESDGNRTKWRDSDLDVNETFEAFEIKRIAV